VYLELDQLVTFLALMLVAGNPFANNGDQIIISSDPHRNLTKIDFYADPFSDTAGVQFLCCRPQGSKQLLRSVRPSVCLSVRLRLVQSCGY